MEYKFEYWQNKHIEEYPEEHFDCIVETYMHGDKIGFAKFTLVGEKYLEPYYVYVHPYERRMGIASRMYELAEEKTNRKIYPSIDRTKEAELFWDQKNRKFGIS